MSDAEARAPLIADVSQYEVDFVIPRVGVDLPLCIDPFLLFKSRDSQYLALHGILITEFNGGNRALQSGDTEQVKRIFDFPEISATGPWYTKRAKGWSRLSNQ